VKRLFVEIYAAEAGNLALKCLAVGGIGAKIPPALENGAFLNAFKNKGRFAPLLDSISVKLALNPHTPLLSARRYFT